MWAIVFALLTGAVGQGLSQDVPLAGDETATVDWSEARSKPLSDLLDTSAGTSAASAPFKCPRNFGLYPVLSSCTRYFHCRYGVMGVEECPANTVFEVGSNVCVHPDQTKRKDCTAPVVHSIACPPLGSNPLRFGDHDRIPHPTDCTKYYICLLNGQPRLASCPRPMVFDPEFGFCQFYTRVRGCETLYVGNEGEVDTSSRTEPGYFWKGTQLPTPSVPST